MNHTFVQVAMKKSFNDVAIVSIKECDCRIHFWYMSKDNAANMMNNSDLNEKSGLLNIFSSINDE